jgi:low affinity Fe/Cu permease
MDRIFTKIAGGIAAFAGQPVAFMMAVALVIVWVVTGPAFHYSDTWQLVINTGTTIVTFLMVFLIQNSQNRDAGALQAKLDELIRAIEAARGEFIGIEHLPDSQIQEIKAALEKDCKDSSDGKRATTGVSVERLLRRY